MRDDMRCQRCGANGHKHPMASAVSSYLSAEYPPSAVGWACHEFQEKWLKHQHRQRQELASRKRK